MPHLVLSSLTKRYGALAAVDAFDLTVERGECIALLGPSGCGKTTTLRMVAGFVAPDAGGIALDGAAIERTPPHRRPIGMVFQSYALFPHLTAAGNVAFGLEMRHVARAERDRRTVEALALVGLDGLGARFPAQLSGGQQQRVALARALVIQPALLLLDEPLSNLDAGLRLELREELAALRRRLGITTLFVTHDQAEALALADRVAVMQRGRLLECATPAALTEHPQRLFTASFLGARTVLPAALPGVAPPLGVTHVVLRAARLRLLPTETVADAPLRVPVTIVDAAWLDDAVAYRVKLADGTPVRVQRPTTEPPLAPGAHALLVGGPDALAWITEPPGDAA